MDILSVRTDETSLEILSARESARVVESAAAGAILPRAYIAVGLPGPTNTRYDIGLFIPGISLSGERVARYVFPIGVSFPTNLEGSQGNAPIAPEADKVYTVKKNGTEVATVTFAEGETEAVFASSGELVFTSGDVLEVFAPDPADALMSDVSLTLAGTKEQPVL